MKFLRSLPLVLLMCICTGCGAGAGEGTETVSAVTEATVSAAPVTSAEEALPPPRDIDPEKPVIALTFDDGPNTSATPRVLDRLEKYDVPGTFFLIGNNINETSGEQVKRAYSMGCEIECHSLTHSYMDKMSAEDIKAEISETSDRIYDLIGRRPEFFRPPYIAVNKVMYDNIDMTFISGFTVNDWEPAVSAEERAKGVLDKAKDGAIILLHDMDNNFKTVEALDTIIPELQEKGYQFVTVSQLFEAKGKDPKSGAYRGRVISIVD